MEKKTVVMKFAPASDAEMKMLGEKPDGFIAGYASTSDLDSYNHIVAGGAFQESINKRGLSGPTSIKLLIGHDWDKVAGVITALEYRGDRLWIEAQLNLNISYARDTYEAAKMAGGLNFSVGFSIEETDIDFREMEDGTEYVLITGGDLFEISVVPFPANQEAQMLTVKSDGAGLTTVAEFEKRLVDLGVVKSRNAAKRVTREVKSSLNLFGGPAEALEAKQEETQPLLADHEKERLLEAMAQMKAALNRSGSDDNHSGKQGN